MQKRFGFIMAACLMMMCFLAGCVTVVPIGQEAAVTGNKAFDAAEDVEAIWASQAVPELKQNAVDVGQLLNESGGIFKSVADKYGKFSMGTSGELSFIVKGEGTVTEVNTEKRAGYMTVQLADYNGPIQIKIQVGPVYKGSAIRDCLSFIKYEDYTNQVDWAKISQSIHDVVSKDVVGPANVGSLQGKKVAFTGAFTVDKNDEILITPAELEVK